MPNLPTVGGSVGTWGSELNSFLQVAHNADGSAKGLVANVFNVKDYNATGNGTTNDTSNIQTAINACVTAGGGTVYFPKGTYLVNGLTIGGNNVRFSGDGWQSILKQISDAADNTHLITCLGSTTNVSGNKTNLVFERLQFLGRCDTDDPTEFVHLLALSGVSDVMIRDCLFKAWRGDAIYFGSGITSAVERHNERLTVVNCTFDGVNNTNRNAISCKDATDAQFHHNYFVNCGGTDDTQSSDSVYSRLRNISIIGNTFRNVSADGGVVSGVFPTQSTLTTKIQNIMVIGNVMQACPTKQISFQCPEDADTNMYPHNVVVVGNTFQNIDAAPFEVSGVRGIRILGNSWDVSYDPTLIGNGFNCCDVQIIDNIFMNWGVNGGALFSLIRAQRVYFERNHFIDADSAADVIFDFAIDSEGVSDNIWVIDNHVINSPTITWSSKNASHTLDETTNRSRDNDTVLTINSAHFTSRVTGWVAPTGTPTRSTFATSTVTLPQLAERVKALIDDLIDQGQIGT